MHLCGNFDVAEVSCAMRMQTYAAHTLFDMNRTVQQSDPAWCMKAGNRNAAPTIGACVYPHADAPVIEETWR